MPAYPYRKESGCQQLTYPCESLWCRKEMRIESEDEVSFFMEDEDALDKAWDAAIAKAKADGADHNDLISHHLAYHYLKDAIKAANNE